MKLAGTILLTALIFWLVQIILFLLLLATFFVHLFLSLLVCFGVVIPDSTGQAFISKLLKALLFPFNQIVPVGNHSPFTTLLLIGLDSLVWGMVLGSAVYLAGRLLRKKTIEG